MLDYGETNTPFAVLSELNYGRQQTLGELFNAQHL
jgi:hypothetical protein